ncbi:unnamed protein product (macronuclear) [Paramecium tetraurelia]|uniref:Uncharacterized protein n=1 Tax=Paramecium tetraurelia TaxID=5888 RepID=A0DCQ5_PARTE|nr:uncharacterized protein GSPATT00039413001 [Paramecium tetraurelia]CAK80822.1 unnamed protein product [Paramecium tetraurelia]|eukprot:XP_001448219.1 hypothetical protein (macronuclear) [Paramecium tetraurelia strain d4-2]
MSNIVKTLQNMTHTKIVFDSTKQLSFFIAFLINFRKGVQQDQLLWTN